MFGLARSASASVLVNDACSNLLSELKALIIDTDHVHFLVGAHQHLETVAHIQL
jgi:REP element-mobilizing transposase RayT